MALKTKSLLLFYIFFEASVIPITLILFIYGYQPEKLQATLYLILYTITRSLPLLIYIIIWHFQLMSSSFQSIPITLAFIVKTPLYLIHTWLPKAHVEAPVGGSMLLAGVLLKLGSYGLLIFVPYIKINNILLLYLTLRIFGSFVCALICMRQGDMKLLIAYSSVVHMGVVTLGFIRGSESGYLSGILMVLAHGLCSPFLFSFANSIYQNSHSRLLLNNSCPWPLQSFTLMGLVTLNMGIPPCLGLWSEVYLARRILSLFNSCWMLLFIVFFFSVLYNLYIYTSCIQSKYSYISITITSKEFLPIVQVLFFGYGSFFCLDILHLSQYFVYLKPHQ